MLQKWNDESKTEDYEIVLHSNANWKYNDNREVNISCY